mmetsp:Transcript_11502/g.37823  ORF Transcript_11502/g.37823 Transcript_11502/m.37823 type:complete len:188 (-) Transcript_11502:57-620(-)
MERNHMLRLSRAATAGRLHGRRARGGGSRRVASVRASATSDELRARIKSASSELQTLGVSAKRLNVYVGGDKNDLVAVRLYIDAIGDGDLDVEEDSREELKLNAVTESLEAYRDRKREEEKMYVAPDTVVSPLTDYAIGMSEDDKKDFGGAFAGAAQTAVAGAVWNTILGAGLFIGILVFVFPLFSK